MRSAAAARARQTPTLVLATSDVSVVFEVREAFAPGFDLVAAANREETIALLTSRAVDAVLVDLDTIGANSEEGIAALRELRSLGPDLVLAAATRSNARSLRLKAIDASADAYFVAPLDLQALHLVLVHALERRATEIENRVAQETEAAQYSFCDLVGTSEPMQRVYDAISRVSDASTTILIRGESGTGKELVARAIVTLGPRRDRPFVSVNCAALPEHLIEAELFGHEKGAFTDAHTARPGHIEMAHTGTLFLDEIGTLGLGLQSKLLRVLEDRAVTRIGGRTAHKVDFRLITATNEDLEEMVHTGRFREDLYYRINVVPIALPPLREREGDIALLIDHFLRLYCAENNLPFKRVEPEVLEILEEDPWPGNVRELQNLVQRLVLMVDGPLIKVNHLPQRILYQSAKTHESLLIPEEGVDFDKEMERIEQAYLQAALSRSEGVKAAAAALLHIDARRMGYLCRKYKL
ncbi:MAG TPA: sigma-54 dependent transcriptional regulator [Terriglobales bacterium]|jgi:DNA-binding NtrC family response regulator|nr:sigma-54 dependent transcriptional regulator [Terriglobales bacterium]